MEKFNFLLIFSIIFHTNTPKTVRSAQLRDIRTWQQANLFQFSKKLLLPYNPNLWNKLHLNQIEFWPLDPPYPLIVWGTQVCPVSFSACNRRCALHSTSDPANSGQVILFTEARLTECTEIRDIRKENALKYGDFALPTTCDDVNGYHIECYCRFVALSGKHRKKGLPISRHVYPFKAYEKGSWKQ